MRATNKMINAITSTLLKGLGVELDESTMTQYIEARIMNLNYYPSCPNPELTVASYRHTDFATFTILLQDRDPTCGRRAHHQCWGYIGSKCHYDLTSFLNTLSDLDHIRA